MTAPEPTIQALGTLRAVLEGIHLAPSGVSLDGWGWETRPATIFGSGAGDDVLGWMIRASFVRPDRDTGERGRGFGRWEFVACGATESAVVKTAWLLYDLVVRHEAMESFTYRGVRIFDPHHTVEQLTLAGRGRR